MDYAKINEAAMGYKDDMTKFLRDLVRIPGESCGEKGHIMRIKEEMEKVGFDKVQIDPMGNILGYMGTGKTLIGFDAHIDTVGIGNIKNWEFDPYEGFESDEEIGGRGTSDQMGGIVSAVYGAKIMKDLGLLNDKYQVLVTGTVQEEVEQAQKAVKILGGRIQDVVYFQLPDSEIQRSLVVIEKVKATPGRYPRKAGTPLKEPLS